MSFKIVKHSWMTGIALTLLTGEQCFSEVFTSWHPLNWHRNRNLSHFQSLNTAHKMSPAWLWSLSSVFVCWRLQVSISQFWGLNIGQWDCARKPLLKITSLQSIERKMEFQWISSKKRNSLLLIPSEAHWTGTRTETHDWTGESCLLILFT